PAKTAARFPATRLADDRAELRSWASRTCSNVRVSAMNKSAALAFVIVRHETVEKPDPKARAPALIDLRFRRAHRGSGDIKMRPRGRVDETLQEWRRRDGTAMAIAGIFH